MSGGWNPGDVVLVDGEHVGLVWREGGEDMLSLIYADGGGDACSVYLGNATVRRLVVIDPGDREQVERLTKALVEAAHADGNFIVSDNGIHGDTTARALREFAQPTPPKPDEPLGLGAVVEDADGDFWVYAGLRDDDDKRWWRHAWNKRKYDAINVVRVLSEGI